MGNNPSVRKFRTDMLEFGANLGKGLRVQTLAMADELIENMREAAPKDTGTLARSLRKRDVSRGSEGPGRMQEVSILVIGGGAPTTRRTRVGEMYDYSLASEFGTQKEAPEPFFYVTYRKYRNFGLEIFKETVADAVKENNELRALRSNYPSGFVTHRGAVISKKR